MITDVYMIQSNMKKVDIRTNGNRDGIFKNTNIEDQISEGF